MRSIIVFLGGHVYVLGIIFLLLIFKDEFPKNWSMTWIFFAPLPTVLKSGFPQSKSPSNIISPVIFMKLPKGPKPVLFPRSLFIFRRRGKPLKQSRSFTEDRSTEVEEEYKSKDRRSLHAQIEQFFGSLVIFSAPIFFRSLFSLYFLSFLNWYITPETIQMAGTRRYRRQTPESSTKRNHSSSVPVFLQNGSYHLVWNKILNLGLVDSRIRSSHN